MAETNSSPAMCTAFIYNGEIKADEGGMGEGGRGNRETAREMLRGSGWWGVWAGGVNKLKHAYRPQTDTHSTAGRCEAKDNIDH